MHTLALAQLPGRHPTEALGLLGRGWEHSRALRALVESTLLLPLLYS